MVTIADDPLLTWPLSPRSPGTLAGGSCGNGRPAASRPAAEGQRVPAGGRLVGRRLKGRWPPAPPAVSNVEVAGGTVRRMPSGEATVELVGRNPTRLVLFGRLDSDAYDVSLVLHSGREVSWLASVQAVVGAGFVLDIGLDPTLADDGSCVEIKVVDSAGVNITLQQSLFTPGDEKWPAADDKVERLREEREAFFNVPLLAPSASQSLIKVVGVVLVEGLLLTRNTRVPGIRVFPLPATLAESAAAVDLLQTLTLELSGQTFGHLGPQTQTGLPLVALYAPDVRAATLEDALEHLRDRAAVLVDVLGANRGARPRLSAVAVGGSEPSGWLCWLDPRRNQYLGNLLGGFISGESSAGLLTQWDRVTADPRLSLWFRQLADARDEQRWEYRILRYVNLLEGMVKSTLGEAVVVVDDAGFPRPRDSSNSYTTGQAKGAIYMAIAGAARHRGDISEDAHCRCASLWDMCRLWTIVRNQAAHAGAWASPMRVNGYGRIEEFLAKVGETGQGDLERELADCVNFVIDAVVFRAYLAPSPP